MSLSDWLKFGWLTEHQPTASEIRDLFRKKRNLGGYERAGAVSEQEAREMLSFARELAAGVRRWLEANHPELL